MSRTLIPGDTFKYIVVVLLAITTYSCSAVRKNNIHETEIVVHETETSVHRSKKSAHKVKEKSVPQTEKSVPRAEKSVPLIKGSAAPETVPPADDDCDCEDTAEKEDYLENEESEKALMEILNSRSYLKYSEKLGIKLDGTENKELITAIDKWFGTRYKCG